MPTLSATPFDVASEYRRKIAALPIDSAFMLFDQRRNTILFTTFFETVDRNAEEQLAEIEGYMLDSFSEFLMDFQTIHLLGRDVDNFIPHGAFPLVPTRRSAPHPAAG